MEKQLLGGMSASAFLRRHWQKLPLLVREAIPGFDGIVDFDTMVELAGRDDCEARLVVRTGRRWSVEHGPFMRKRFSRLPAHDWTLLVQGLERMLPAARHLLSHFSFIPYSRLDDVMISYAPAGGGVGPHFDSYDVFLLQGPGQRRWGVSRQRDLALVDDAPLKLLKRFSPDGHCLVSPGDLLYLPPAFCHDGVAVGSSFTYSIGFRAPSHQELASQFLIYLEDRIADDGRYNDADLSMQANPAQISAAMLSKVGRVLRNISWTSGDVTEFLGRYLSEPKALVVFSPPHRVLSQFAFTRAARRNGVELSLASLMLYGNAMLFINGESHKTAKSIPSALRRLADTRQLSAHMVPAQGMVIDMLYRWYRAGYIYLSKPGAAGRSNG